MKRAVIITGHFPVQKRRGSILWVSQHLQQMGWHVTHVTVGYSWLSVLKRDERLVALGYKPKQGQHEISKTLTTIYGLSPIHPLKTGYNFFDNIIEALQGTFSAYWRTKLRRPLVNADLIICESGAPVLLAPLLSKFAPRAARVYRVNDDIRLLNAPDFMLKAELENTRHFTRISSANHDLTKRFRHNNISLDPMCVPQKQLEKIGRSPFLKSKNLRNVVCAGSSQLDHDALDRIARSHPNWQIHILGRTKKHTNSRPANLLFHGELLFSDVLNFIAHADIGLAPYLDRDGIQYQTTNSNRMLLYRHFGLPILGPDRLCNPNIPNIIGYSDPNVLDRCETAPKRPEYIQDWATLALALSQNAEITPPTEVV